MKQLILTGLATEQKFGLPSAQFYLVFNDGELRVPVTEEAANVVVQEMYGNAPEPERTSEDTYEYPDPERNEDDDDSDSNDGVTQI